MRGEFCGARWRELRGVWRRNRDDSRVVAILSWNYLHAIRALGHALALRHDAHVESRASSEVGVAVDCRRDRDAVLDRDDGISIWCYDRACRRHLANLP